jgi:hypothetical protein
MLVLQRCFFMQPVIAAAGAVEMLAWLCQRAAATPGGSPAGWPAARALTLARRYSA